MSLGFKMLKRA